MKKTAAEYLRIANETAKEARKEGNTPFGAILVGPDGEILIRQGNAASSLHDETAHAERMTASLASQRYPKDFLKNCTLYTTCEPCPMCTGAIYWAGIGHIVFGMTESRLLQLTGGDPKNPTFHMGAQKVIDAGQKNITLEGPFPEVEEEIAEAHAHFWKKEFPV